MNSKNLTPSEILIALGDGKILRRINTDHCYKLDNGKLQVSAGGEWSNEECQLDLFLNLPFVIYTEPAKPKSLSEKFADEYPMVKAPYIESSIDKCRVEFYHWLKDQELKNSF